MKNFKFKINGTNYDVAIEDNDSNIVNVNVNGSDYKVELDKETQKPAQVKPRVVAKPKAAPVAAPTSGGNLKSVNAPLPGNILSISVKQGDPVKTGDVVLVMEAMKMENNVIAEHDGVVANIKVNLGQAVMQNDVLIEIQ
jgi:glutaconyl-CoA/methylmalonyl-CoA decarboxylase subunit gamma